MNRKILARHGRRRSSKTVVLAMALCGMSLASAAASAGPFTLRRDHPDLSADDARAMTSAALGDALLAPGHVPIEEVWFLPAGMAPLPPPGSPIRLQIRFNAAATLDRPSGFCVRRSVEVVTMRAGAAEPDTITAKTSYRLPDRGAAPCVGLRRGFFAPTPADRLRTFAIVRLLASAMQRTCPFPVTIDDVFDRDMKRFVAEHPNSRLSGDDYIEITDPCPAVAQLPIRDITYVDRDDAGYDGLLAPTLLKSRDGRSRERWRLILGGTWTVDLVLDGDKIAAMALRNAFPPPF